VRTIDARISPAISEMASDPSTIRARTSMTRPRSTSMRLGVAVQLALVGNVPAR
jgi:hypothetical protein